MSLIDTKEFNDVVDFSKKLNKDVIVTRGEKCAVAINNGEIFECKAKENLSITDLTGAGDLFAAGYLHGIVNNMSTRESLEKGTELSSIVIQKVGARI